MKSIIKQNKEMVNKLNHYGYNEKSFMGKLKRFKAPFRQRWIKRLKMFIAVNVILFLLVPKVFYGFWGGVSGVVNYVIESRIDYNVRCKYGETVADARQACKIWGKNWDVLRHPHKWFIQ